MPSYLMSSLKGCCYSLWIMTDLVFLCRRVGSQLDGLSEAFYRISRCSGLSPRSHLKLHKYERQAPSRCKVFSTHSQKKGLGTALPGCEIFLTKQLPLQLSVLTESLTIQGQMNGVCPRQHSIPTIATANVNVLHLGQDYFRVIGIQKM